MKLRRLLAVILSLLMLVLMAVPAVSASDDPPICGVPYLELLYELEATVEHAKKYAALDGVEYTEESLARLNEAINEAEAFLAVSDEGTEAQAYALIEELNLAVEGLEGDPVVPYKEIPFYVAQECRISGYPEDTKNYNYLVKSPEEMDGILDNIYGQPDDVWYPKPTRDEKYNDEYFQENAVVIGLYEFYSGSLRQSIEKLTVEGDTLTVYRNIYCPEGGTDDIQWRYALIEVKLSDVEGVYHLEDSYTEVPMDQIDKVYGYWGDVNNDGDVNVKDATAVQKNVAQLHLLRSANLYLADANCDGAVNIKDATEIQKHTAEIVLQSPVGTITKVNLPVIHHNTEAALTELYHTIREAKEPIAPGSNFVADTMNRLMDEIEKAEELYDSLDPYLWDVIEQTQALREAIDGLEYVSLDISRLVPLQNEADALIDSGLYTEESIEVLIEASFNAQMVCLYGQSQTEVEASIYELQEAIDALVLITDSKEGQVPFRLLEERRIESFGAYDKVVYLVKSPEEMDSVLSTIEEGSGFYDKPVRDESFNDEYFAEKSLVISMSLVGGSCCSQSIDKLIKSGDTLTLYRTRYQTVNPTPDMNYQYVLIEVDNDDIRGIVNIREKVDNVSFVEIIDTTAPYTDPTFDTETTPEDETITVYFTNTQNWESVNIHYWGGEESTSWPGMGMNFVENNTYGQDVYSYVIPADTTGIVFNDQISNVQTVDILTGIKDCGGFYPSATEDGKWLVETYEYTAPDPVPTSVYIPVPPVDNTESTTPATIDETEIDFAESVQCRVQGWGDMYEDEQQELYVVRNTAEFDTVLDRINGSLTDVWEPKPVRDEKYNDEYFMSNALVVCLIPLASGSYTHTTDRLTIDGNTLTVHKTVYTPSISTCDMNYQYVLIEVNAFDVRQVTEVKVESDYRWLDVEE